MSFTKRPYTDGETIITAENMNAIQDELIRVAEEVAEGGLVGPQGEKGEDGFSPIVNIESQESGTTVSITDAYGVHEFEVLNGEKGDTGAQGPQGEDSPLAAMTGLSADDQVMVSAVDKAGKPTAWKKKARGMLNVRDFGAKGDGSTDDTAAIQAAIDHVQTNGIRALYFPAGTYLISSPLHAEVETGSTSVGGKTQSTYTYGMGLTLRGEQVGKTVLRKTGTNTYTIPADNNVNGGTEVDTALFFGGSMGTGLYVSDMSIENASTNECYAIYATRARVHLERLNVCTNSHGIYLYGWLNNLTDILIQAAEKGLWVANATSTVCNKVFVAGCNNPYYLVSAYYSTLISCCADNCTGTIWTLSGTVSMVGCGSESKNATHYIETTGANTQVNADNLYLFDLISGENGTDGLHTTYFQTSGLNNSLTVNGALLIGLDGSASVNNALVSQTGGMSYLTLKNIRTAANGGNVNTVALYKGELVNGTVFELNCLGYYGWFKWDSTNQVPNAITEAELKDGSVTPAKTSFIIPADGHYEAQPNYTNLAPSAVSPENGMVINAYGGCPGYRYSATQTVGAAMTYGTSSVNLATGLIPAKQGDVIRTSGLYAISSSNDGIYFLDADKHFLGGTNGTNLYNNIEHWSLSVDADAQAMTYTIPAKDTASHSLANTAYIAINGRPNQTGSFIVTVNEEIVDKQVWVGEPMQFGTEVKQNMANVFIQSPNGTLYTITVDDSGNLSTTAFAT